MVQTNRPVRILLPGSFDLLHEGHLKIIIECARLGETTIALGTDDYQESYKRRPIQPYYVRKSMVERLGVPVIERDRKSIRQQCMDVDPDYIARGYDWRDNDSFLEACGLEWPYIEKNKIGLLVVQAKAWMHTSDIIAACQGKE